MLVDGALQNIDDLLRDVVVIEARRKSAKQGDGAPHLRKVFAAVRAVAKVTIDRPTETAWNRIVQI